MKLNNKWLFLAALIVLAMPLIFTAGNAGAFYGGENCLACHDSGTKHNPNGSYSTIDPTKTGHWNMQRVLDGTATGGILDPLGAPYATDFTNYIMAYDGWLGLGEPRTVASGGSYTCGSCHSTGYVGDKSRLEPAFTLGAAATANFTGSWNEFGIKCERCHGVNASQGGYSDSAQGNLNNTCADLFGATYVGVRYRNPGVGAPVGTCPSDNRVTYLGCSSDLVAGVSATLLDPSDPSGSTTFPAYDGTCTGYSAPETDDGHHINRREDILDATDPNVGATRMALCTECHTGSHDNGFLNSPHSRFEGATTRTVNGNVSWAGLDDPANYDTHFMTSSHEYGGCTVCHNVHASLVTVEGADAAIKERCGVNCHNPASPYTPEGGMKGFHDGVAAFNSAGPDTMEGGETGSNPEACMACHMPGGKHLFRNNPDASYVYEIDATTPEGAAECVAQGGHVGSSHGATVCMDATGAHMGRIAKDANGYDAEWNDVSAVCLQCHDGSVAGAKTLTVEQASKGATNYHTKNVNIDWSFAAGSPFDAGCENCHAQRADTFANTGHHNMQRALDGSATGGILNPAGKPYPQDLSSAIMAYDGWLGYNTSGDALTVRTAVSGGSYTCGACHSTGYAADKSAPEPAATLGIAATANFTGSWDRFGIQCERCHGKNTADSHDASVPQGYDVNALCGQCHTGSHDNGFLNSPHARFSGTTTRTVNGQISWEGMDDAANYDSHFSHYGGTCAACHDVHKSVVEAANPDGGAVKECTECHTGTHGKDLGLHQLITSDAAPKNCQTCHMPGGEHLFRINPDPTYKYELDVADAADAALCVAQGGHVGSSHGATVCLDATGAHMGRVVADENGYPAQWNDLSMVCQQCHKPAADGGTAGALTVEQLASYAEGYHTGTYQAPARFNWYKGSGCNVVTFDASMNTGATSYSWTFGDTTTGSGSVITHTFPAAGNYSVTLALNDGRTRTMVVTASGTNQVPTTGMTVAYDTTDASGMTLKVTDGSTANSCGASSTSGTATILWGDGSVDVIATAVGTTATTHQYNVKGTYTIRYSFRDSNNNKSMADPVTKSVPSAEVGGGLYTVSGVVTYADGECVDVKAGDGACGSNTRDVVLTGKGVPNATIYIKTASDSVIKIGKSDSNGVFSISGVQGGQDLKLIAVKTGVNFDPVEIDLNLSADSSGNTFEGTLAY